MLLQARGAEVVVCASASEALDAVSTLPVDIVISDIAMPGQDGFDFMRQLRERYPEKAGELPAVALTAHASPNDAAMALAAGFQRHLTKPVEPAELVTTIAQLTRIDRATASRRR
jgi:CheY-like chemotaxis protein